MEIYFKLLYELPATSPDAESGASLTFHVAVLMKWWFGGRVQFEKFDSVSKASNVKDVLATVLLKDRFVSSDFGLSRVLSPASVAVSLLYRRGLQPRNNGGSYARQLTVLNFKKSSHQPLTGGTLAAPTLVTDGYDV